MTRLGVVKEVKQTRSLRDYNEYRVYFEDGSNHYTRWDGVLRVSVGDVVHMNSHGKWLKEV